MKRLWIVLVLVVVVALVVWLALGISDGDSSGQEAGDWLEATVTRRDISSSIRATGIIKPMVGAEVRVGSRISGVVRELHVSVGDRVTEGQLLAVLDATELESRLDQAVASLNMRRAELDYAKIDLNRKQDLEQSGVAPQADLEIADNAYRVALLRVREAEANVEYARTQLAYSQIYAPISGVVASVATQEGETVAASFTTPTFVTIIDLDRLELWAYVDETDIGRVTEEQTAVFTVDTYPDADFEGTVLSVYPDAVIENTVVNYIVIIGIGNRQGRTLRPEMTANVTILLDSRRDVIAVPRRAVRRDRGRYVVYVPVEDGREEREVSVGWRDDNFTEILEGLQEGDTVLIEAP